MHLVLELASQCRMVWTRLSKSGLVVSRDGVILLHMGAFDKG
jgi:hypothetical protein